MYLLGNIPAWIDSIGFPVATVVPDNTDINFTGNKDRPRCAGTDLLPRNYRHRFVFMLHFQLHDIIDVIQLFNKPNEVRAVDALSECEF